MTERTFFWGMLTPHEVRRASLWAVAGAVAAFAVAPALQPHGRLLASLTTFVGSIVTLWTLTRIGIGAPGWRVGARGEFDEREMAERHRALSTSYVIVSLGIMTWVVLPGVARLTGFALPPFGLTPPPVSAVLIIFFLQALPGIILAWRRRPFDDFADDEE